jgi:hypothetical protein
VSKDNISGSLICGIIKASFHGVKRAKVKEMIGKDENGPIEVETDQEWTKMYWDITKLEIKGDREAIDIEEEGNGFGICSAKDDSGYPFLRFDWTAGDHCIDDGCGGWLGKRCIDGKFSRLTDGERQRLGIGLTEEEVEELAKKGFADKDDSGDGDGAESRESGERDVAANVEAKAGVKRKHNAEDSEDKLSKRKS